MAHIEALAIEIVKCSDQAKGFVILPRRWIVERTFAWLNRCRRLAKDREASIASSEAWMFISSIRRMTRRIARIVSDTAEGAMVGCRSASGLGLKRPDDMHDADSDEPDQNGE